MIKFLLICLIKKILLLFNFILRKLISITYLKIIYKSIIHLFTDIMKGRINVFTKLKYSFTGFSLKVLL